MKKLNPEIMLPEIPFFSKEVLLGFIDHWLHSIGAEKVELDIERFEESLINTFRLASQVSNGERISLFKTAAAWVISFVEFEPIRTPLQNSVFGTLTKVPNHQNAIVALAVTFSLLKLESGHSQKLLDFIDFDSHYSRELVNLLLKQDCFGRISVLALALIFETLLFSTAQSNLERVLNEGISPQV